MMPLHSSTGLILYIITCLMSLNAIITIIIIIIIITIYKLVLSVAINTG
jgi:hypothetical protein